MVKKIAAFMIVTDSDNLLYPPLLKDVDTDFFILTNLSTLQSSDWQIKVLPNSLNIKKNIHDIIENPSSVLGIYDKYIYIENNEIVIGKSSDLELCKIAVPSIATLLPHDTDLTMPPKMPVKSNPVFVDGPYEGYPYQLSICLPMGNRHDTLRTCLEALKPILSKLKAELIIVDSSNDGSTAIAKEYTDKIIPYIWQNDFSHARNTAIQAASGSWILSIDDDEWFDSTDEIIEFFTSDEHFKYDAATYTARNYTTTDGSEFSDFDVLRMAKNHPELHYTCRIHECFDFEYLKRPVCFKNFTAFVHHYSYAHTNDESKSNKVNRNLKGLFFDLQDDPFNLRLHFQLCNEAIILQEYKTAAAYCFRLLSLCKLMKGSNSSLCNRQLALVFLYLIAQKSNHIELIPLLHPLTNLEELNAFQKANIYYLLAVLYFNNAEYESASENVLNYYKYRKIFMASKDKVLQSQALALDLVTSNARLHSLYFMHAYALQQLERPEESEKYFELIDFTLFDDSDSRKLALLLNSYPSDFFMKMLPKITNNMLEYLWKNESNTKLEDIQRYLGKINTLDNLDFEKLVNIYLNFSDCTVSVPQVSNGRISEDAISGLNAYESFFYTALLETLVFKKGDGVLSRDSDLYIDYVYSYTDLLIHWATLAYSKEILNPELFKMLPSNLRGAIYFKKAESVNTKKDIPGYMNCLKLSVVECPLYKDVVKLLLKRLVEGI